MATIRIGGASFSPDGRKLLFHSNQSGVFNVYEIPVEGGSPAQLTHSIDDAIFLVGYFPNDERFSFSSDGGGNELTHIFVRERDGSTRNITPAKDARAAFAGWAHDGGSFFVSTNERDPRFTDLYEYATDGDARYVALVTPRTTSDSDIWLFDRRVLRVESDEIVEAVRRNGVPVEYVLFPDEGPGFVN